VRQIDEFINSAKNAVDAGRKLHLEAATDSALQEYEDAIDTLESAVTLAEDVAPERVQSIEQELRRVRVRRLSSNMSSTHRTIRDTLSTAREHTAAGDSAFHCWFHREAPRRACLMQRERASRRPLPSRSRLGAWQTCGCNEGMHGGRVCCSVSVPSGGLCLQRAGWGRGRSVLQA
jgi:hypothetical protein